MATWFWSCGFWGSLRTTETQGLNVGHGQPGLVDERNVEGCVGRKSEVRHGQMFSNRGRAPNGRTRARPFVMPDPSRISSDAEKAGQRIRCLDLECVDLKWQRSRCTNCFSERESSLIQGENNGSSNCAMDEVR